MLLSNMFELQFDSISFPQDSLLRDFADCVVPRLLYFSFLFAIIPAIRECFGSDSYRLSSYQARPISGPGRLEPIVEA